MAADKKDDEYLLVRKKDEKGTGIVVPLSPGVSSVFEVEEAPKKVLKGTVRELRDWHIRHAFSTNPPDKWNDKGIRIHDVVLDTLLSQLNEAVHLGDYNKIAVTAVRGGAFYRTVSEQPSDLHEMIDLVALTCKKRPLMISAKFTTPKAEKIMKDYCAKKGYQFEGPKKDGSQTPPEPAEASFKIPKP